ncbi:Hypothetical predicted protein [Lecanosticta acicola]|uniref:Uncharacterized protein n=1 Tax=Lecanosticta acicola TaxID=111012 RepID=A0AAI9EBH5_9PEZI|nr:Hypothetical predicted protein [Lecanosticta acicola]
MDFKDPIAIICGITLIATVLFMFFMLTCISRRSARDVWKHYDDEAIKTQQQPIAEWRVNLKKQVQREWNFSRPEAIKSSQATDEMVAPLIPVVPKAPSSLPAALTVGRDSYGQGLSAHELFENVANRAMRQTIPEEIQPVKQSRNPLRLLPTLFFEGRRYAHVPYFAGDDSGPDLEAQLDGSS